MRKVITKAAAPERAVRKHAVPKLAVPKRTAAKRVVTKQAAKQAPAKRATGQQPLPPWNIYIVRCADGSLYTGVAIDVTRRIAEHNGNGTRGARYTRARRPVKLVYQEPAASRSQAGKREYAIKQFSRAAKLALIASMQSRKARVRRTQPRQTRSSRTEAEGALAGSDASTRSGARCIGAARTGGKRWDNPVSAAPAV